MSRQLQSQNFTRKLKKTSTVVDHTNSVTPSSDQTLELQSSTDKNQDQSPGPSRHTRSVTGNTIQFEHICFVCNVVRPCDDNPYSEGVLGVCEFSSAANRLIEAVDYIDEVSDLNSAKERLLILTSGESKDIFSAEIRYHRSCYLRLMYRRSQKMLMIH